MINQSQMKESFSGFNVPTKLQQGHRCILNQVSQSGNTNIWDQMTLREDGALLYMQFCGAPLSLICLETKMQQTELFPHTAQCPPGARSVLSKKP